MGGALANAIYDAIGVRLFQLPMTPDRIKEAVKKG
jgi:CO/xanthine dehydrogenase Mo-binding subunit